MKIHFDPKSFFSTRVLTTVLLAMAIILAGMLVFVKTKTDNVNTSVIVGNFDPTINSMHINDDGSTTDQFTPTSEAIVLNPKGTNGGVKTIHVTGQVTDYNGVGTTLANGDLAAIAIMFYRTSHFGGMGQPTCSPGVSAPVDNNDCYVALSVDGEGGGGGPSTSNDCTLTATSATTMNFDCPIPLAFWADATPLTGGNSSFNHVGQDSWSVQSIVVDDYGMMHDNIIFGPSTKVGIAPLLALSFPSTLSYGSIDPGFVKGTTGMVDSVKTQLTEVPLEYVITQAGNASATVKIGGGDLTCTLSGSIPRENQHWSISSYTSYNSTTPLVSSGGTLASTHLSLGLRTSESLDTTSSLFFNLLMPSSDVGGSCTGTTIMTAEGT